VATAASDPRGSVGDRPASFVAKGRLAQVKGQNILFSASRRAIFTLNDAAADIWWSLEQGSAPAVAASRLARRGVELGEARRQVDRALDDWQRLGLIEPARRPATADRDRPGQVVRIGRVTVRVVYPDGDAGRVAEVFRHLAGNPEAEAEVLIELVERDGHVQLFRDGSWLASCRPDEAATVVKGQLLTEVLEHADYELALHGAALVRDDRILLLSGSPGAGKTTLTLALVDAGFGFAGDDVVLLDAAGRGFGLPFAPAVKSGAWPLLAGRFPGLAAAPVFRRPDRRRVRYPVPEATAPQRPRALGWVVLLDRAGSGAAALEPVDPAGALCGLLDGAFALDRELTPAGFDALTAVVGSAETWRLSYAALDDAVALLARACR
jgi:hypothetical protein